MIHKKPILHQRIRKIQGSFAWISHSFLRNGFWSSLNHHELLLYMFLVLAADRKGISYYSFDKICSFLDIHTDEYILARNELINKDLIAFDGHLFQVLSLPENFKPIVPQPIFSQKEMMLRDPATIHQTIKRSLNNE
jgi:hypothetical protein